MRRGTSRQSEGRWARTAVAAATAAVLGASGAAGASQGSAMAGGVRALGGDAEVPETAKVHLGKAYQYFQGGAYENAEAELKRAAFFAPEWQPLTYDLAVVAEAQGHIDDAIERYEAFRPHAVGDTGLVVDQRIAELRERKVQIKKEYRRQLALAGTFMVVSVGGGGVGAVLLLTDDKDKNDTYGYILAGYAALAVVYASLYMAKVVKSKERRALALMPTARGVAVAF